MVTKFNQHYSQDLPQLGEQTGLFKFLYEFGVTQNQRLLTSADTPLFPLPRYWSGRGSVASATDMSKAEAGRALDAVLDGIAGALSSGDQVALVGFGTFLVSKRKATTGRNPQTGESINIPAANVPKFRAGKALKESLN